jgi:hypothetical protein
VNCNCAAGNAQRSSSIKTSSGEFADVASFLVRRLAQLPASLKRSKEIAGAFGARGFEKRDLEAAQERYDGIAIAGYAVMKSAAARFYQKEERKLLQQAEEIPGQPPFVRGGLCRCIRQPFVRTGFAHG